MIVILQTEIEVPGIQDNWDARNAAKWQFFKQLMNTPPRYQWKIIDQMSASIYEAPPKPTNYLQDAEDDAKMLITDYFIEEIVEQIVDDGEASDDINTDYGNGDGIFHETIVDKDYNLTEAAEVLSQLYRVAEEDSGLWEGLEPERAIGAQAAYTYGNAVYSEWANMIADINSNTDDKGDLENKTAKQILKWMYKKTLTKEDRENIQNDYVNWTLTNFNKLFEDIMYALVEQQVLEIVN